MTQEAGSIPSEETCGSSGAVKCLENRVSNSPTVMSPGGTSNGGGLNSLKRRIIETALACASEDSLWLRALPSPQSPSSPSATTATTALPSKSNNAHIQPKRRKHSKGHRISFCDTEDIIVSSPYEEGRTDAEAIALYQTEIWYANKDYEAFLKDRADTLRVYRSVGGDLSCLRDHYSVRGLEHYTQHPTFQPLQLQINQKNLVAAVLAEQARQKKSGLHDADALQQQVTMRTTEAYLQAMKRGQQDEVEAVAAAAAASTASSTQSDDDQDSEDDDEDDGAGDCESISLSGKTETTAACSSLVSSGKLFPVDTMSLHDMNLHLLDQMRARSSAAKASGSAAAVHTLGTSSKDLMATFQDLDKELEHWDAIYERQRLRRNSLSSQRGSGGTTGSTTAFSLQSATDVATNCALAISSYRRDSLASAVTTKSSFTLASANPSLLSLQAQGIPLHGTIQARLGPADSAATLPSLAFPSFVSGETV